MTEIATIDWFGRWGHLFALKTLLYLNINSVQFLMIKLKLILNLV